MSSDLANRTFVFSGLDSLYCVQALVLLENRLTRQRAKAVYGSPVHKALDDEIEWISALRNRFSYGATHASTASQIREQGALLPDVSPERRPDQGS